MTVAIVVTSEEIEELAKQLHTTELPDDSVKTLSHAIEDCILDWLDKFLYPKTRLEKLATENLVLRNIPKGMN